jgi:hypothetical protein
MREYLSTVLIILTITAIFSTAVLPAPSETDLAMTAHWDDGTAVAGAVTFGAVSISGRATVIATKTLSNGRASVDATLAANSLYNVALVDSDGTQLVKIPITTALIKPENLDRAEVHLVFRRSNNSVKSADFRVSMKF